MKKYKIVGGNALRGKIRLHGSKNATLPILAASVLTDEHIILNNVPVQLNDVQVMLNILDALGKSIQQEKNRVIISGSVNTHIVPSALGTKIRYSLLFLGALLHRLKRTWVPNPGGCAIGSRKFDLHLFGLEQLGAQFDVNEGIEGRCQTLKGTEIQFYLPTTSGTQNVILGALAAEGSTILNNANTRPEIVDFVNFLSDKRFI